MTSGKTHLMVALLLTAAVFSPRSAHADDTLTALKNAVEALQGQMQKMQESYESQIASLKSRIDILEKEKTAPTQANASPQTVTPPSGLLPLTPPAANEAAPATTAAAPPPAPQAAQPTGLLPLAPPVEAASPQAASPSARTATSTYAPPPTPPASAGAFNPAIAAVLNGQFGAFSKNPDNARIPGFELGDSAKPGPQGFSLGESEIALSANIDQDFYGNLILSFDRDNTVSVEEGYIQTTSLPYGFTVKAGRFFSGIGYLNERHAHDWDFIDAPLPYRAFLNTQYGDDGLQVRWLAPTDMFLEFGAEAYRGDAFPAANAANEGKGAFSGFVHFGQDIDESSSFLAGLSFLQTRASDRFDGIDTFTGKNNLGIASLVYKWAPNGNPVERNLIVNGEYFLGNEEGVFDGTSINPLRSGWYLQAVYQFMPRWRFGLRHDEVEADNAPLPLLGTSIDPNGHTPMDTTALLEFDTSEFSRIRLQFSHDNGSSTNNEFLAAYTAIFGPHGAHRF